MKNRFLLLVILAAFCGFGAYAQAPAAEDTASGDSYPLMDYDNPKMYVIKDIRTSGVKFIDPATMLGVAGLQVGDSATIPGAYISSAMDKLWRMRYFSDVDITAEIEDDGLILYVKLQELPRVNSWNFEGISKAQTTQLKEKLKLNRGSVELSTYIIDRNIRVIKDYYAEKGFRNAQVEYRIDNVNDGDRNLVDVTFIVDRGDKVRIGEITFTGNDAFSDKRLARTFKKTKKKGINPLRGAKYNEKDFEGDQSALIEFYTSQGYRNAHVLYDSMYVINDRRIGLNIGISEGNKFYLRNVDWVGNSLYQTDLLNKLLDMDRGDVYDKKKVMTNLGLEGDFEDPNTVSALYQNVGYISSQIDPSELVVGNDSIDLTVNILEGNPARWNEVNISGNYRVNDEVIRRELATRPGDLYNRALIMRTMRLLMGMQHFNAEAMVPDIRPVTGRDLVDVTWQLEETASDRAEVSGGWGSGMFIGSVGLVLNNFSIKNLFKGHEWRPYPQGQNQQLSIRAQTNGKYYSSVSLGFTEPWLGGKKPNSLTVSTHYSNETNATSITRKATRYFRTYGLASGIGRRLSWPDQNFTLYNELSYQAYKLKDWNYFIMENGTANIIALRTQFSRNTIDNPIFPSSGSEFLVSVSLTPPYSLFDGQDYKDPNLESSKRYKWVEYHKWKLKGEWYTTLARGPQRSLVLMTKAEMGYLGHYNKHKLSPFEGFDVGGDGMSGYNVYGVDVIALRGYDNGTLTPLSSTNDYARVYNKYTLELRYPLIMSAQANAYALVFAEGGNAFSEWSKFNPFQLKRSMGVGVRLYLPIVGLIGVDWGYGFDRAPGETKRHGSQMHYVIGTQF